MPPWISHLNRANLLMHAPFIYHRQPVGIKEENLDYLNRFRWCVGENAWELWGPQQDERSTALMESVLDAEKPSRSTINILHWKVYQGMNRCTYVQSLCTRGSCLCDTNVTNVLIYLDVVLNAYSPQDHHTMIMIISTLTMIMIIISIISHYK